MQTMNKKELIEFFSVSESLIKTNFPTFCVNQLKKGYLITKRGKGESAIYEIEKVEPRIVDKSYFSTQCNKDGLIPIAQDETWIETYCSKDHEVSNYGRIRKKNGTLLKGYVGEGGYHFVSIHDKTYRTHRIVLQSFYPIEDFELLTVNHINGIRTDNKISNLEWMPMEENTNAMIANRIDLNKELTRIIQQIGYEQTLDLLKQLP